MKWYVNTLYGKLHVKTTPTRELVAEGTINAEQAMLQNENTKLMVLYHAAQAQELTRAQQAKELSIANRGSLRTLPPIGLNP